jgi:thiosulfate/3-mercaptopyruvate sulfurtransferase
MSEQGRAAVRALVSPDWLEANRDDPNLRLIEVAGLRPEDLAAYHAGHLPGAISWKWKETLWDSAMRDFPTPQEFARRMAAAGISNDSTVVVYGEGVQFGVYAWWVFRYCGHENVRLLDGGRHLWQAEGRPLEQDVPSPPPPAEYRPAARNDTMRILRDEVIAALGDANTSIIDARSPEEYAGERVGAPGGPDVGAMRAGRIPGAKHLHYLDLLDENRAFKSPSELRALFEARVIRPDTSTIAYCRLSHRATVVYFALTEMLGFKDVRVYDGSWTEWGNLVGAPIER